jgi:hypothetical protein
LTPYIHFLTQDISKAHRFECVKIEWTSNDLHDIVSLIFVGSGFITESYIFLECFKKAELPMKTIYLLSKNTKDCTVKELIWSSRVLNFSYSEFVDWLTNNITYGLPNTSGEFESKSVTGLEIRYDKTGNLLYPSITGVGIISNKIFSKWSVSE